MIIEFKVANYRSIHAEQVLSMVASADKGLPNNLFSCDRVPGLKETKVVKAIAIYGANASGKSNVVDALRFFVNFVCNSATKLQTNDLTGVQPFKLDPKCMSEPSKFEITAIIRGVRTLYGIELTRERVVSEYLVAYPKGRPQVWFERDWDKTKKRYKWSKSNKHFRHDASLRAKTRENCSFVTVASQFAQKRAAHVVEWFESRSRFLLVPRDRTMFATLSLNMEGTRDDVLAAARRADLGISSIRIKKGTLRDFVSMAHRQLQGRKPSEEQLTALEGAFASQKHTNVQLANIDIDQVAELSAVPELLHLAKGNKTIALDFYEEESEGTRRFLEAITQVLAAAYTGGLVVFDEIESSLHPHLVSSLIDFFLKASNPKLGAQIIFTTHNPLLLERTLLRRDQIWFTEKDDEGATRLYPLTDFKPRKDESLVKGYLAGRYGGIPFIPEGLKS